MEPIRVGQLIGKMRGGGVEAVVMNYYRHIDRGRVQFDFFVCSDSTVVPQGEIEALGGRVYYVPPYERLAPFVCALARLLRENQYQIVHAHMNTLNVFPLLAARLAGVPVRISHSHSTAAGGEAARNAMKYALRPFSKVFATHYAACSRHAGAWLFGKRAVERGQVRIIHNAIDLGKFRYDREARDEVREELGLGGKFVVGHVGRFTYQKNQDFVVDVFEEIRKRNPDSALLMVGDGEDFGRIRARVEGLAGVGGGIRLLGNREDVARLLQAMDVLLLPSRYEGLGMVAVEAQARGLRVLASTNVPREAQVSDGIGFLPLGAGARAWAEAALGFVREAGPRGGRLAAYDIRRQAKELEAYDIRRQAKELEAYYGETRNA